MEDEVGDLFFVLVNIARYLSLDSESALRKANRKFRRRFAVVEDQLREARRTPRQASLDELETLWQQAKQKENRHYSASAIVIRKCHELEEIEELRCLAKGSVEFQRRGTCAAPHVRSRRKDWWTGHRRI